MKKLVIIILIIAGIFISQDKEKYLGIINEKIDIFIPENIQTGFASGWEIISTNYEKLEARADVKRSEIKDWSIAESVTLIESITGTDFIPVNDSFSPILDNNSLIFSTSTSIGQKLYASFLFVVTLLFWNFKIFAVWVCIIAYIILKKIKQTYFPKRRKSFFDKINERAERSDPDDAY